MTTSNIKGWLGAALVVAALALVRLAIVDAREAELGRSYQSCVENDYDRPGESTSRRITRCALERADYAQWQKWAEE